MIGALTGAWIGWRHGWRGLAVALVAASIFAWFGGTFGPRDVHKPASASAVPANVCDADGGIASVIETNTSGVFTASCRDGVPIATAGR
jgi:hypothetical protein